MDRCIYCGERIDLSQTGDHVIPRVAGEFSGDRRFKRICVPCNTKISTCEEHVFRCAPESLGRLLALPQTSTSPGSHGAPSPRHFINHGDHQEHASPKQSPAGTALTSRDQIAFRDSQGRNQYIHLHLEMTDAAVRDKIAKHDITPGEPMHLHAEENNWNRWRAMLEKIYPGSSFVTTNTLEAGTHRVRVRTRLEYNEMWRKRVYAKIALHYYLTENRRAASGDEEAYRTIRRYIMGDHEDDSEIILGTTALKEQETMDGWCHHIQMVDDSRQVIVSVALFQGPVAASPPFVIRVAAFTSRTVYLPTYKSSHLYVISGAATSVNIDGVRILRQTAAVAGARRTAR